MQSMMVVMVVTMMIARPTIMYTLANGDVIIVFNDDVVVVVVVVVVVGQMADIVNPFIYEDVLRITIICGGSYSLKLNYNRLMSPYNLSPSA